MKKSALIVLIAALAVVLVCTGLGAAYLMTNQNNGLVLEGEGDTFREEVVIDGLAPGQERACSYRGESASPASLVVSLTADDGALARFLSVRIAAGDEVLYDGGLADCAGKEYRADVEGEFAFTVTYRMDAGVGNEAQGAACTVTAQYALEGAV